MSTHYSKFLLNTYAGTPYFQAHLPSGYPLYQVLRKSRAFRRLPPNLQELSILTKQWAVKNDAVQMDGIDEWYDAEGNELDPNAGIPLTDEQIDAEWDILHPEPALQSFTVTDIGDTFANPDTWQPPPEPAPPEKDTPTPEQVARDTVSHGSTAVDEAYGLTKTPSFQAGELADVAQARFRQRANSVLRSKYVRQLSQSDRDLLNNALQDADIYEDLGGRAEDLFDRAEAAQALASGGSDEWLAAR